MASGGETVGGTGPDDDIMVQLVDTVRRFAEKRLRPLEAQVSETDTIPEDVIQEMRDLGLFGLSIPTDYDGLGLNMAQEVAIVREMGKVSPAFRGVFGTSVGIGSQGIVLYGTPDQKARWLPRIASGEVITSFALTEAEAGSDSGSVQTRATRQGDGYVLNGSKRFITNADRAGLFTVIARTNPEKPGAGGVTAFLVPAGTPGLTIGKAERKMGQQGIHIHEVTFDDVHVPADARLGAEGEGFKVAMRVLDRGRLHIAALCVGVAERLIEDSLRYASERRQFGQAIAGFQFIQGMLADSETEAMAARCMVQSVAAKHDGGDEVVLEAAACKYFASEMVGRVADRAVQIFGGAGYVADYGIERLYRDVRVFRIYEGTSQIQQLVIAREMQRRQGR